MITGIRYRNRISMYESDKWLKANKRRTQKIKKTRAR